MVWDGRASSPARSRCELGLRRSLECCETGMRMGPGFRKAADKSFLNHSRRGPGREALPFPGGAAAAGWRDYPSQQPPPAPSVPPRRGAARRSARGGAALAPGCERPAEPWPVSGGARRGAAVASFGDLPSPSPCRAPASAGDAGRRADAGLSLPLWRSSGLPPLGLGRRERSLQCRLPRSPRGVPRSCRLRRGPRGCPELLLASACPQRTRTSLRDRGAAAGDGPRAGCCPPSRQPQSRALPAPLKGSDITQALRGAAPGTAASRLAGRSCLRCLFLLLQRSGCRDVRSERTRRAVCSS